MGHKPSKEEQQDDAYTRCVKDTGDEAACDCTERRGGVWHPDMAKAQSGALGKLLPGAPDPCVTPENAGAYNEFVVSMYCACGVGGAVAFVLLLKFVILKKPTPKRGKGGGTQIIIGGEGRSKA